MPKLPRLTAREIITAIEKAGFVLVRQSGSHAIYKNEAGRRVTIPVHAAKVLHPKLLRSIMRDADLTAERLQDLL